MNKQWIKLFGTVSLLLLFLSACGGRGSEVIYRQESRTGLDDTCLWLSKRTNYHNDNFYDVFNAYYEKQLKKHEYDKAALALSELAELEMYFSLFRESTRDTILSFEKHYRKKVSWDNSLFVDSYLGNYELNQNQYRNAMPYFRRLIKYTPFDFNTCVEVAHGYGDLAYCYFAIGDHEKAIQYDLKALEWFKKTDNENGKGAIYDNLALVHLYIKDYKASDAYFKKAMNSFKQVKDTVNMLTSLHNKIILYQETDNPMQYQLIDSAYHFFKKSKLEDESLDLSLSAFYVEMLLHENRVAQAGAILEELKPLVVELNSPVSDVEYTVALAEYEIKSGKGIKDIALIEKALETVIEEEDYQNQAAFAEVLRDNALLAKNYEKAFFYSEKLKQAENSISNQKVINKTMELNKLHETKRKEEQIAFQKETISNGKTTIALLFSLLMGLLLVLVIVFSRQRQKKIKTENKRAQQYTKQLLDKTEEERRRIASDLHDSVSHELLNLKHSIGSNPRQSGEKIDSIIKDIRSISRNLHPVMFEKVGLSASINQLLDRAQSVNQLMVTSDIVYCNSLSVSDELQVYRIIQEALSNIIKYAEAVAAKIIIRESTEDLMIQIKDNGKGFNVQETLSKKDAFGLHNIIERSKAIGGHAKIHSDKNGTIITIDLKKTT
ncbi:tetratricopeptide repeat protein [Fluviicola sp.]|uniref:ATP-binding protein n=1 Tax=Fluviicola sp. TaxID=1917219 RepID=UPI0031E0DD51